MCNDVFYSEHLQCSTELAVLHSPQNLQYLKLNYLCNSAVCRKILYYQIQLSCLKVRQSTVAVLRYVLIFRKLGSRIRTKAHQASMAHAKASGPQSLSLNFAKMDTTSQNFFYPEWISSE